MKSIAVFLVLMPVIAITGEYEMTTKIPECVSYSLGRIEVKGTYFDVLHLYAIPDTTVPPVDIIGKVIEGNTVFEFVPDTKLNCFNLKSKGKCAALGICAFEQWHKVSAGQIGGGSVFRVKPNVEKEDEDNEFVGFCLRFKCPEDVGMVIKLEYK